MSFTELLDALGHELRLPSLCAEPDGRCAVQIGAVTVCFTPEPPGDAFHIRSHVGHVAHPVRAEQMQALLHGNQCSQGLAIGGFAVEGDWGGVRTCEMRVSRPERVTIDRGLVPAATRLK